MVTSPTGAVGTEKGPEGLGAVRGPGVGSVSRGLVDSGWGRRAKSGFTVWVRGSGVQTASLLALPGMAVDSQLVGEETRSAATEDRMARGAWAPRWEAGQGARVPAASRDEGVSARPVLF